VVIRYKTFNNSASNVLVTVSHFNDGLNTCGEGSSQGMLTEGEGSVQMTSSLSWRVLLKRFKKIYCRKVVLLNRLVQGGQLY